MYSNKVWLKTIIILFTGIFLTDCGDNTVQVQQIETQDEILSREIVGTWKGNEPWRSGAMNADWYRIDFKTDGTFIDTIFNAQKNAQYPETLIISRSGNYSIQNQVLEFSNVSFSHWTTSGQPASFFDSTPSQFISINNDALTMEIGDVLSPETSTGDQLKGKWKSSYWFYSVANDTFDSAYYGRREGAYTFGEDSSFTESWKFVDRPDLLNFTWQGIYQYHPPLLLIITDDFISRVEVEYRSSKMYWHCNNPILKMDRIK